MRPLLPLVAIILVSAVPLAAQNNTAAASGPGWKSLFDGKTLAGWRATGFGGQGEVKVEDGAILMQRGKPLTGVNCTRTDFPKLDYEIRYEAQRREGNDFFAALTFPVGDSHATFVTGGWGGDIIGISSIDGWDASENETRSYFNFENNRWYTIGIRVTAERIQVWIDDKPMVNLEISGRGIDLRPGPIEASKPLGFAAYASLGAIRKIEYRTLHP